MSASIPLKFGIVGCGRVVRELHTPAWRSIEGAELRSICDASEPALREMSRMFPGIHTFTDYSKFLAVSHDLAFVDVATPGPTHAQVVHKALKHGLNVICEKPLALCEKDASALYESAAQAGVMLTTIHNYRYKSNSQAALDALKRRALGDITMVATRFRTGAMFAEQTNWLRRERESRTVLFDSGIHLVDLAMLFLGPLERLRFVDADVDGLGIQRVVFGSSHHNGSRGLFDFLPDAASSVAEIEVQGESGALLLQFYPPGFRMLPARDTPVHRAIDEFKRGCQYFKGIMSKRLLGRLDNRAASHAELFKQFVNALRSGSPNPIPPEQAMRVIALLDEVALQVYQESSSSAPHNGLGVI